MLKRFRATENNYSDKKLILGNDYIHYEELHIHLVPVEFHTLYLK